MEPGFFVPSGLGEFELVEKKSRFIGRVWQIATEEEAKALVEASRKQYHDARHHCWCYCLDERQLRYSDDGEPQGTAGQPMLNLFLQERIQQVCCVVTRYFGGTLLGTGGLVRAYTHCAKGALAQAGRSWYQPWMGLEIITPYPLLEQVQRLLAEEGGQVLASNYGADVELEVEVPGAGWEDIIRKLEDRTAGQVLVETRGEVSRLVPVEIP